jgi:hypothetical protein
MKEKELLHYTQWLVNFSLKFPTDYYNLSPEQLLDYYYTDTTDG